MKPAESRGIIKSVVDRGYVFVNGTYYPPNSPQAVKFVSETGSKSRKGKESLKTAKIKSGWIDDTRNLKNKEAVQSIFARYVMMELGLEVWPEFFFDTVRLYRFDYAIPVCNNGRVLKIAIEQEGGIWMRGKSGHSSGTGIQRDMDKSSLANAAGWTLIRRTPDQLLTVETIDLIRASMNRILA